MSKRRDPTPPTPIGIDEAGTGRYGKIHPMSAVAPSDDAGFAYSTSAISIDVARSPALARTASARAIVAWLLVCCALVFAMVVVGGITRLTHSGLSITEWRPIVGTLPPLADTQWQEAFAKYQLTPEYQQLNKGMSLDAFKG